jgi:hypothetical protein
MVVNFYMQDGRGKQYFFTQNHGAFGLFPLSGILGMRKHNISETGSVSETSCFLVHRILDDGRSPKTQ